MERTAVLRQRCLPGATIVAAWLLLAIAWTPPTVLVGRTSGAPSDLLDIHIFFFVVLSFLPWMAATPFLLVVARRYPVSLQQPSSLLVHAAVGLFVIPAATLMGRLLSLQLLGVGSGEPGVLLSATAITSLYSVPTYIAVAAIGQGLYLKSRQARQQLVQVETPSTSDEMPPDYVRRIAVREKGRTELINVKEIDYIDVGGHYLCIHVGQTVHVMRGQLSALELQLDPVEFARVHRSSLVRLDRVRAIEERRNGDCDVILADGSRLLLSRQHRDTLRTRLGLPDL